MEVKVLQNIEKGIISLNFMKILDITNLTNFDNCEEIFDLESIKYLGG